MRAISLFSGAGGFDLGMERAGVEIVLQVENDPTCLSVLERHWPDVPRIDDVRKVDGRQYRGIDLVFGGWPCQDLSVAGKRAGFDGERSSLFFEFARIVDESRPRWVCGENVPGLLSLPEEMHAVVSTLDDLGYLGCWRVCDAQFWGVPQRRRRVFLVAGLGAIGERAPEVLLEPESSGRHPATRRQARQGIARDAQDGAGGAGVSAIRLAQTGANGHGLANGVAHALDSTGRQAVTGNISWKRRGGYDYSEGNGVAPTLEAEGGTHTGEPMNVPLVAGGVTARYGKGTDSEATDALVVAACDTAETLSVGANQTTGFVGDVVAHAVTASAGHHGHSSPRGDGSDNLIVADTVRSHPRPGSNSIGNVVATLTAGGHPNSNAPGRHKEDDENLVAFHATQSPVNGSISPALGASAQIGDADLGVSHTLSTRSGATEDGTGRGTPRAASPGGMAVRRLMPVECERLQGWPDGHTEFDVYGKPLPDSARYRLIGNGVAAPVAEWIGRRLIAADEAVAR